MAATRYTTKPASGKFPTSYQRKSMQENNDSLLPITHC